MNIFLIYRRYHKFKVKHNNIYYFLITKLFIGLFYSFNYSLFYIFFFFFVIDYTTDNLVYFYKIKVFGWFSNPWNQGCIQGVWYYTFVFLQFLCILATFCQYAPQVSHNFGSSLAIYYSNMSISWTTLRIIFYLSFSIQDFAIRVYCFWLHFV